MSHSDLEPRGDGEKRALAFLAGEPRWPSFPPAGTHVDHFVLESELGRGGMGVVYRAHDRILDRQVALKLTPLPLTASARERHRVEREGRVLAALRHAAVVAVHGAGTIPGFAYVAMDLIEGVTMRTALAQRALDPTSVPALLHRLAAALAAAHRHGIVHRDVKPENILLDAAGQSYLADFGLAHVLGDSVSRFTRGFVGTLVYAAPEQVRGEPATRACDVFAFGLVAFEALTGVAPRAASSAPLAWPRSVRIDRGLRAIVARCTEPDPTQRYHDATELEDDLARWQRGERVRAERTGLAALAGTVQRHRRALGLVALVAALALSIAITATHRQELRVLQSDDALSRAQQLFVAGEHDASLRELEQLCASAAPPVAALAMLADRRLWHDEPASALALYERVLALRAPTTADVVGHSIASASVQHSPAPPLPQAVPQPVTARDWMQLSLQASLRQDYERALATIDEAVRLEPTCYWWRLQRAGQLRCLGRHREALEDVRLILATHPDELIAITANAAALHSLERFEQEVALLRDALARHPDDAGLHASMACALDYLGPEHKPECARHAARAYEIAPHDPFVVTTMGRWLRDQGRLGEARRLFEEAQRPGPYAVEGTIELARLEAVEGNTDRVQALAARLMSSFLYGAPVAGLQILAELYSDAELPAPLAAMSRWPAPNLTNALEVLDQLERRQPSTSIWPRWRADQLMKADRWDEALEAAERAVAHEPDSVLSLRTLAAIQRERGHLTEALQCIERALGLEPDSVELMADAGEIWLAREEPSVAGKYARQACARAPRSVAANLLLARCLAHDEDLQGAADQAEVAADLAIDVRDLIAAGRVMHELGLSAEAVACFERALQQDPRSAIAWREKGRVLLESHDGNVHDREAARLDLVRALELNAEDGESSRLLAVLQQSNEGD